MQLKGFYPEHILLKIYLSTLILHDLIWLFYSHILVSQNSYRIINSSCTVCSLSTILKPLSFHSTPFYVMWLYYLIALSFMTSTFLQTLTSSLTLLFLILSVLFTLIIALRLSILLLFTIFLFPSILYYTLV